jgi:hypothetical protein
MTKKLLYSLLASLLLAVSLFAQGQMSDPRSSFRVKYVANGAVYLDGGAGDALSVGMKIRIRRDTKGAPVTDLAFLSEAVVISVASNSSACELQPGGLEVQVGDIAELESSDKKVLQHRTTEKLVRRYAQVVSFTENDDPLEADLREAVPHPPLPEVNRIKGMISFDASTVADHSSLGSHSSQMGIALRADMTRIGGSYWNFNGYWHGRRTSSGSSNSPQTLNDLMNRTYHIGFNYNNPKSANIMGIGRLVIPWAGSLSTIDGGYYARRLGRVTTLGVFAGSTPDPTAWNYDPSRQIGGVFTSFDVGHYDALHYTGSFGIGQARLHGRPENEFGFFENNFQVNRKVTVYHSAEVDYLSPGAMPSVPATDTSAATTTVAAPVNPPTGMYLSRSFLTVRFQPSERFAFDFNHNYFKTVPTPDARLVGTGLLDTVLFTGLNGGFRIRVFRNISVYSSLGKSDQSKDTKSSWNTMYGLTINRLPLLGLRADLRTSKFNSSFGSGTYQTLSLSRSFGTAFHIEVQAGQQNFLSAFTAQNRARFVNTNLDWFLSRHYVLGGGLTSYRGQTQNYDQWFFSLGYRF